METLISPPGSNHAAGDCSDAGYILPNDGTCVTGFGGYNPTVKSYKFKTNTQAGVLV